MKRHSRALTLVELAIVIIILLLVAFVLFRVAALRPTKHTSRRLACNSNLGQIIKACTTYQESNGDFFPAYWDGSTCDNPMMSLSLLYPAYIDDVRVFRCPQTEDRPEVMIVHIGGKRQSHFGPVDTDEKCSYMYDSLSHFRDVGMDQAMAADADGQAWRLPDGGRPEYPLTWARDPQKPNHEDGQNVMYFDGHVKWKGTNYASEDPMDNIYCPNTLAGTDAPCDPDTDAYVWDGANARPRQLDESPAESPAQ